MVEAASRQDSSSVESGLNYRVKIMYGVGEIANAIKMVTFGLYSMFFATTVMGLPGTWMGIVGFAALLCDAVVDPFIGYLTDDTRARSRRYSFMLIGALTMGISFWAFFSPPQNLSTAALFAWLLLASLVVRAATSMYTIPYYALGANLTRDYHERTSITAIRGVASTVGTLTAASLSFVVFFPQKVPGVDPKLEYAGYSSMGLCFGLVMTTVALIAVYGTLPLQRRLASDAEHRQQAPGTFFSSMWDSLRNPSFRVLLFSFALFIVALATNSSLMIHFLTFYVKVSGNEAFGGTQLAFFVGGLAGIAFWLQFSRKFEKHWMCAFSAVMTAALMLSALAFFGKGHLFGTGDVRPLMIGYGLTGFFNCILWFIPPSMLADVVDENELVTGTRRDGACFGIISFGQQVATGLAVLLTGVLLEWYAGLVPGEAQQSALTTHRIAIVFSVVPAVLFLTAALLILRYKLTRSRVMSIQRELHKRRMTQEVVKADGPD